jgi:hypothetical protein
MIPASCMQPTTVFECHLTAAPAPASTPAAASSPPTCRLCRCRLAMGASTSVSCRSSKCACEGQQHAARGGVVRPAQVVKSDRRRLLQVSSTCRLTQGPWQILLLLRQTPTCWPDTAQSGEPNCQRPQASLINELCYMPYTRRCPAPGQKAREKARDERFVVQPRSLVCWSWSCSLRCWAERDLITWTNEALVSVSAEPYPQLDHNPQADRDEAHSANFGHDL